MSKSARGKKESANSEAAMADSTRSNASVPENPGDVHSSVGVGVADAEALSSVRSDIADLRQQVAGLVANFSEILVFLRRDVAGGGGGGGSQPTGLAAVAVTPTDGGSQPAGVVAAAATPVITKTRTRVEGGGHAGAAGSGAGAVSPGGGAAAVAVVPAAAVNAAGADAGGAGNSGAHVTAGDKTVTCNFEGIEVTVRFGPDATEREAPDLRKHQHEEMAFTGAGEDQQVFGALMRAVTAWRVYVETWRLDERTAWVALRSNLAGPAVKRVWHCGHWRAGLATLFATYGTEVHRERSRMAVQQLKQQSGESGLDFLDRLELAVAPHREDFSAVLVFNFFLRGLREGWAQVNGFLLGKIGTLEEGDLAGLRRVLTRHGEYQEAGRRVRRDDETTARHGRGAAQGEAPGGGGATAAGQPTVGTPGKGASAGAKAAEAGGCYLCQDPGHFKKQCPQYRGNREQAVPRINAVTATGDDGGATAHVVLDDARGVGRRFLLDTGSTAHMVPYRFVDEWKMARTSHGNGIYVGPSGQEEPSYGTAVLPVRIGSRFVELECLVGGDGETAILSLGLLGQLGRSTVSIGAGGVEAVQVAGVDMVLVNGDWRAVKSSAGEQGDRRRRSAQRPESRGRVGGTEDSTQAVADRQGDSQCRRSVRGN